MAFSDNTRWTSAVLNGIEVTPTPAVRASASRPVARASGDARWTGGTAPGVGVAPTPRTQPPVLRPETGSGGGRYSVDTRASDTARWSSDVLKGIDIARTPGTRLVQLHPFETTTARSPKKARSPELTRKFSRDAEILLIRGMLKHGKKKSWKKM